MRNNARVVFDVVMWGAFIAFGAMDMAGVHGGLLTSYGADVVCPAMLYVVSRRGQSVLRWVTGKRPTPEVAALAVLAGSFAWELNQRYRLGGALLALTRGTFDPLDLLAYTAGVVAVYLADRLSLRKREMPGQAWKAVATLFMARVAQP
ncbi:MAG: hypothetical protein ABI679_07215 [Gemmatimonadota bacterium]